MPFPPSPPFNPSITSVPVLNSSSGDPKAKQDPKSVASIGANIQAMTDQANADTLYDAPIKEGFSNSGYVPWIVKSEACKRFEGFSDYNHAFVSKMLVVTAAVVLFCSFLNR
jgi:hypothetical protein